MQPALQIEAILRDQFAPLHLSVIDESARHVGHAGAAAGGGHFRVVLVSDRFRGLNRLARHRAVYDALGAAMGGAIHALALQAWTPEEWAEKKAVSC